MKLRKPPISHYYSVSSFPPTFTHQHQFSTKASSKLLSEKENNLDSTKNSVNVYQSKSRSSKRVISLRSPRAKENSHSQPISTLHFPMTPYEAKTKYIKYLTPYEIDEIQNYPQIYFLGWDSVKNKANHPNEFNNGFDTAKHHYKITIGDHIAYRYEIQSIIGQGSFGEVLKCLDHKTNTLVAIKVLENTPTTQVQGEFEISILQHLSKDNNSSNAHIIQSLDSFHFRNHICISFPILGKNLYQLSQSLYYRPVPTIQLRHILYQLLTALSYCHSNHIIHCDIKPENIVLLPNSKKNIRLIDFGSACEIGRERFDYIQSRFYRAPEVILGIPYGPPMDLWSFGCVVAEMIMGKPLFSGENEQEVLDGMMQILGKPPVEYLAKGKYSSKYFYDDWKRKPLHIRSTSIPKRKRIGVLSLSQATKIHDDLLLDLIQKCLEWDPSERITASQALLHPWFQSSSN